MRRSWIGWDTQVFGNFTATFDWKTSRDPKFMTTTSYYITQIYSNKTHLLLHAKIGISRMKIVCL